MILRARRDAAAATIAADAASGQELFGWKLAWDHGGYSHDDAHTQLSLTAAFRRLPHLVATSARLAWGAGRLALLTVAAASIGRGVTSAVSLLATNQVLVELFAAGATPGQGPRGAARADRARCLRNRRGPARRRVHGRRRSTPTRDHVRCRV